MTLKKIIKSNNFTYSFALKSYEFFQKYFVSDEKYIRKSYFKYFNKTIDLSNPLTINEKLQWLKLNDRKEIYRTMVDKYEVRGYIEKIIGDKYLVPCVGVYRKFTDIDFDSLPDKFVLKCTHDSHSVVICEDKTTFDIKKAKQILNRGLSRDFYYFGREWPYKNVEPRIICEEYIEMGVMSDLKVHCYNGKAVYFEIHTNRFSNHGEDIYNLEWKKTKYSQGEISKIVLERPAELDKIVELSEKLAESMINVRVDWYITDKQLYIGELTLCNGSGIAPYNFPEYDLELGHKLKLK